MEKFMESYGISKVQKSTNPIYLVCAHATVNIYFFSVL